MRVCVFGLWHLGAVTAACLASGGHSVVGLADDARVIADLTAGKPPMFEPGLAELVRRGIAESRLSFTNDVRAALRNAEIVWVAFDTPVDEDDHADVEFVVTRVLGLFPHLEPETLILISSQLPVGATRRLEAECARMVPEKQITFAYSPENLRLGKAIDAFTQPDRVVVGARNAADRARISDLFHPFTARIEWMSVESAEMTKHALNAFLATSVTFANEIAALCERVGADAQEVERGLKSESRIGSKAYLGPGAAFAGGTLARDIAFLTRIGAEYRQSTHLLSAVKASNDAHKSWAHHILQQGVGDLRGKPIAVWGLTYKPGTDTLRRSSAVELCLWLASQGARVTAFDPAVKQLPTELQAAIHLAPSALEAAHGAVALVVATAWQDFLACDADALIAAMASPYVIDANRLLAKTIGSDARVRYVAVGKGAG